MPMQCRTRWASDSRWAKDITGNTDGNKRQDMQQEQLGRTRHMDDLANHKSTRVTESYLQ